MGRRAPDAPSAEHSSGSARSRLGIEEIAALRVRPRCQRGMRNRQVDGKLDVPRLWNKLGRSARPSTVVETSI
jgi:hypothetical protein